MEVFTRHLMGHFPEIFIRAKSLSVFEMIICMTFLFPHIIIENISINSTSNIVLYFDK
jgi:hypothetical protein